MRASAMASPACHSLSRVVLPDLPLHHLPPRPSLFPFPASLPDPYTNYPPTFSLPPASPSLSNSPFVVRTLFEDAVCAAHPVLDHQLESAADISTDSSDSSLFMSSNSDDDEDDTSSSSTSAHSQLASPPLDVVVEGPLDNLTSLCAALPIKRGLSRYFSGKSQSFSSLARVSSVVDLAKPENPYVKRRRTGMRADSLLKHHSYPPRCASSSGISKRSTTSNRYRSLKSLPRPEDASSDGLENPIPRPSKCFSVPEF